MTTFSHNGRLRTNSRNLRIYLWEHFLFKSDKWGRVDDSKRRKCIPRREQLTNWKTSLLSGKRRVVLLVIICGGAFVYYWIARKESIPLNPEQEYIVIFNKWVLKMTRSEVIYLSAGVFLVVPFRELY